jgi:molecular chaperone DnaK
MSKPGTLPGNSVCPEDRVFMLMRTTVDYGIDLGTSNSAIAEQKGLTTRLLEEDGDWLVPSIIHIDTDSNIRVGKAALKRRLYDSANSAIEFKRLMGTNKVVSFPSSGRQLSPVDLSSKVLKYLLHRAEAQNGNAIQAAVITIPAMFQLPQCDATKQAAELAGLQFSPLLQEPIAAAIASVGSAELREGYWLIYDLGGGTFDVSLVRSRNGKLQVLDHDGDNHLGGKDFDRILARRAAEIIRGELGPDKFQRTEPALAPSFERLKIEAERVRIALSTAESEEFFIEQLVIDNNGGTTDIRFSLNRDELASLLRPTISRTTSLCKQILKRNKVSANQLKSMVLVGGPTCTPCLLQTIEADIGIEARHYVDPSQAVAIGAAIYASTQRIPSSIRHSSGKSKSLELELSYEPMTNDPNPLVAGRIVTDSTEGIWTVQIISIAGEYISDYIPVREDMAFMAKIPLQLESLNVFRVKVYCNNTEVAVEGAEFSIIYGTSIAKPVLSQSIGVMLANNSVHWYLRKGAILPTRETVSHTTTLHLNRGQSGIAVQIPLIQGDNEKGDRNTIVGILEIQADNITRNLPVGSEVKVTLAVDEHSTTTAEAYLPLLDQTFREVIEGQRARLQQLERMADELQETEDGDIDERVRSIEDLLDEGGSDDINQADQMLKNLTGLVDSFEAKDKQSNLVQDFESKRVAINELLKGKNNEQFRELGALSEEFKNAVERADYNLAESKLKAAEDLEWSIWRSMPEYWMAVFDHLSKTVLATENASQALLAIDRGKAAINSGNWEKLVQACVELSKLIPQEQQAVIPEAIRAHIL